METSIWGNEAGARTALGIDQAISLMYEVELQELLNEIEKLPIGGYLDVRTRRML
jgi:hypothetical protein